MQLCCDMWYMNIIKKPKLTGTVADMAVYRIPTAVNCSSNELIIKLLKTNCKPNTILFNKKCC